VKTLLITVDDLGLHPAVQRAVEDLSGIGVVNAASVMANGPYCKEALSLKNSIFLGAHLNILRGKPILPPKTIPSVVDKNGYFLGSYSTLFLRYVCGLLKLDEVKKEWKAQIDTLLETGFTLAHLDSEKHIHCWPRLIPIIEELSKEYDIKRVRYPVESPAQSTTFSGKLRSSLLRKWSQHFSPTFKKDHCTDVAWGLSHQERDLSIDHFIRYLNDLPEDSNIEIICHPGKKQPPTLH